MRRIVPWISLLVVASFTVFGCAEDDSNRDDSTEPAPRNSDGPNRRGGGGAAVGGNEDDPRPDVGGGEDAVGASSVRARLQLEGVLGPFPGEGTVEYRDRTETTDEKGRITLSVRPAAPFEFRIEQRGYLPHRLIGRAGSKDFRYPAFVSSRTGFGQMFSILDATPDSQLGILVVGVQTPNFQPLEGARVRIDRARNRAVTVTEGGTPRPDRLINPNEKGFVAFPNVRPGSLDVAIRTPNDETCRLHPGGEPKTGVEVEAGAVTVVTFVCS